jgi:hypothetical protein
MFARVLANEHWPFCLAASEPLGYHETMKNITLSLDEATYQRVEHQAVVLGTSVGEMIVAHLQNWALQEDGTEQARRDMNIFFARPDWRFAVGAADDREQRNARR